jgi:nitrite reductase (NADH) small subunit
MNNVNNNDSENIFAPLVQEGWFYACREEDVPENGGVCVKYNDEQIALFHFTRRGEWYATQNECPHRQQMALSRGMIGTQGDDPKVACPFHKRTFSLKTGECLNAEGCGSIKTYPVKVEEGKVFIAVEGEAD